MRHVIEQDLELRVLDNCDAEKMFELVNSCRDYLRQWLPWVDSTKSLQDIENFIEITKKQFSAKDGLQAGI